MKSVLCLERSNFRFCLNIIMCFCTAGVLLIAQYWSIRLRVWLNYRKSFLGKASHVRVFNSDFSSSIQKICNLRDLKYFDNRFMRYIFQAQHQVFIPLDSRFILNKSTNNYVGELVRLQKHQVE